MRLNLAKRRLLPRATHALVLGAAAGARAAPPRSHRLCLVQCRALPSVSASDLKKGYIIEEANGKLLQVLSAEKAMKVEKKFKKKKKN